MSPLENLLVGADSEAARLGHAIVWQSVKKRAANGRCSGCGRDVTVAEVANGRRERDGRALQESCTRDYILKKPTVRRWLDAAPAAAS